MQELLDYRAHRAMKLFLRGYRKGEMEVLEYWVRTERKARLHAQKMYQQYNVSVVRWYRKYRYYKYRFKRFFVPCVKWFYSKLAERAFRRFQDDRHNGEHCRRWVDMELRARGLHEKVQLGDEQFATQLVMANVFRQERRKRSRTVRSFDELM